MMLVERAWQRKCPECGHPGTMVLEEPKDDASGRRSRWLGATGCWRVEYGVLIHKCVASSA